MPIFESYWLIDTLQKARAARHDVANLARAPPPISPTCSAIRFTLTSIGQRPVSSLDWYDDIVTSHHRQFKNSYR